jgi:O-antigen biosynthesis protein
MEPQTLAHFGYSLNQSTGVWARPAFSGIAYSDGDDTEEALERAIDSCADRSVYSPELTGLQTSWATKYHLGSARSHLFKPVEHLLKGKSVLEIGSGCGAITRYLGEVGSNVLALEGSPRRARIGRKRTQDLANVTVLNERFGDFDNDLRFDIVTMIGVLEYAAMFGDAEDPHLAMLEQASRLLKPGGTLLVAIENQLGLKYFTGALEDHLGEPFYGVEDRYAQSQPKTFGRKELLSVFHRAGLQHTQTLAPFPDYKLPSVLVTESGFDTPGFNAATLIGPTESSDEQSPRLPVFSQSQTWPVIIRNGLGLELANSFFIVASNTPDQLNQGVLAYHFSANRGKERSKCSVFRSTGPGAIEVISENTRLDRLEQGSQAPGSLQPYHLSSRPLVDELHRLLTSSRASLNDIQLFFERYRNTVCALAGVPATPRATLPAHFLDAIPQNLLIQGPHCHLIDSEWESDGPLAFDRLLFRAIIYSFNSCRLIRLRGNEGERSLQDTVGVIFEHLGEEGSPSRLQTLAEIENDFQKRINPAAHLEYWQLHKSAPIRKPDLFISHDSLQRAHDSAVAVFHDKELHLNRIIAALSQHNTELESSLRAVKGSTSWRITEPLRRLMGKR